MITAVLTSCGRHDLLEATLRSFFEHNTAPLAGFIVVEDGPEIPQATRQAFSDRSIDWVSTGDRVGQLAAIDYAYSRVRTPYIFHMEDDWVFYRPGFIERSLAVLEANPKCIQAWIRAVADTNGHPVEEPVFEDSGVFWRRMALEYLSGGSWHGFSLNPGLRRLRDYTAIGGYGINGGVHARYVPEDPHVGLDESRLSSLYRTRGFFAAILTEADGTSDGYIRHTGWDRQIGAKKGPRP